MTDDTIFANPAQDVSDAMEDNSGTVGDSIAALAKSMSQGTHDLMHNIAISDEVAMPDEQEDAVPVEAIQTAPGTLSMPQQMLVTPGLYKPQGAQQMASILSQLEDLQRQKA